MFGTTSALLIVVLLINTQSKTAYASGCPEVELMTKEPINFDMIAGFWYGVKVGPSGTPEDGMECIATKMIHDTKDGPDKMKTIFGWHNGSNGPNTQILGSATLKLPQIVFTSEVPGMEEVHSTIVGIDSEKTWLLLHNCFVKLSPPVDSWLIMTRRRVVSGKANYDLDPAVEQQILDFLLKKAQVPADKLRSVKQGWEHCPI